MENSLREIIQEEAVIAASNNNYGTIDVAVRVGKTLIGLKIASKFKKCLISIPNKSIKSSWDNDSVEFNMSLSHCTFTTHVSLKKHNLDEYDIVILDEIQDISQTQWEYLVNNLPNRMYGLTGTPPVRGIKKKYLDEYCPIIYSKKLDETVGQLQKDYEIIVHCLEPSVIKNIPLKSGNKWSEKAKLEFWERKYRTTGAFNEMLRIIQAVQNSETKWKYLEQLTKTIKRGLIFVETKEQCKKLPYKSYYSGNKHSEKNLEDFQNGKIDKLVCVRQLSAGITFKNLNEIVILHAYASNSKSHQRLARSLQYVEGETATIHIICLKDSRDTNWCKQALNEFDNNKIKWK